ncbi:MAG: 5'-methylthioadenosine/S-adenosylhomocysteine nucleosidase, partial [Rikenellaceae bacterium]
MIGIIVAMQSEMELLREQLTNTKTQNIGHTTFTLGEISSREVVVAQSGIGKVNSALTAREMIATYSPDIIINTGVAGGLDASLHVGDIVVASETTYNDAWCGEGNEWGQIQGLPTRFIANKEAL